MDQQTVGASCFSIPNKAFHPNYSDATRNEEHVAVQWFRHYAASQKVTGMRPNEICEVY
jgi:hypothetical protein